MNILSLETFVLYIIPVLSLVVLEAFKAESCIVYLLEIIDQDPRSVSSVIQRDPRSLQFASQSPTTLNTCLISSRQG
jgi:hypothetical protein